MDERCSAAATEWHRVMRDETRSMTSRWMEWRHSLGSLTSLSLIVTSVNVVSSILQRTRILQWRRGRKEEKGANVEKFS